MSALRYSETIQHHGLAVTVSQVGDEAMAYYVDSEGFWDGEELASARGGDCLLRCVAKLREMTRIAILARLCPISRERALKTLGLS